MSLLRTQARSLLTRTMSTAANNFHIKTSAASSDAILKSPAIKWPDNVQPVEDWLATQPTKQWNETYQKNGVIEVLNILTPDLLEAYRAVYNDFISGAINAESHRWDLGSHQAKIRQEAENVLQIMWPSDFVQDLDQGPLHQRAAAVAKILLKDSKDVTFDFDMLIAKAPFTDTPVPWHCDEAYWPDMPDKAAVSCWTALDDSTVDNGCMWFALGSHLQSLRQHAPASPGSHVLKTQWTEAKGTPVALHAGSCTFHSGRTLHYSRGNTTGKMRRAYITNFRPAKMVEWERNCGFDHGRKAGVHGPGIEVTQSMKN